MTEAEAVRALQAGDAEALEFLVLTHQLKALRFAFAICGNQSLAEDVVADAFLAVFQQIKRFDADRPFEPWFLRIVVNGAISSVRKGKTARKLTELLGRSREPEADPIAVSEQNETRRELIRSIRALPAEERAAITIRYLMDFDEKAAANILGWPVGTLKTRLRRARGRLRSSIDGALIAEYQGPMAVEEA
jgi:RNA polymerase sigma-70 factor (ECF subfamily)